MCSWDDTWMVPKEESPIGDPMKNQPNPPLPYPFMPTHG